MSLAELTQRPCTIIRRSVDDNAAEDSHGNKIPTENQVETTCYFQQDQRLERAEDDELGESKGLAIFRADEALHTGDAVVLDGETYELVGDPWRVENPRTQTTSHVEVTLRRTAGPGDEVGS